MLYIDSADRDQVERLLATGLFAGVTTNPTILRRAGLTVDDVPTVLRWARAAGAGTVFLQAVGPDETALKTHGRQLADLGPDVVVKLPATRDGLAVSRRLTREGVPVLATAVYHASQALVADAAGAGWIAPYVGRMSDLGLDGGSGRRPTSTPRCARRARAAACSRRACATRPRSRRSRPAGSRTSRCPPRSARRSWRTRTPSPRRRSSRRTPARRDDATRANARRGAGTSSLPRVVTCEGCGAVVTAARQPSSETVPRATPPSQPRLGLGVRSKVSGSHATSPNVGANEPHS